jgi:tripartite-type tricarboxylate transporter receptor subunit TctC
MGFSARLSQFALAAALVGLPPASAWAQTPDQAFKGKTIDLVIGYPPGGANDVAARVLAAHLAAHIPGHPAVVPRNMPGAGSFVAANYMARVAPKDGTALAIGAPTLAIDEKLGTSGVHYKTAQFAWIGRISPLINIIMIRHDAPAKTIKAAEKQEVTLAGTGAGSTASIYPNVMNHMFGTKFKLVMGYSGSNEAMLAVDRGEVQGHSTAWDALQTAHPNWVPDGFVVLPVQFALERIPDLPNVPTALEFAKTAEQKAILRPILNATEVGLSFFTAPGVPQDRVELLRRAFDETMLDPAFRRDIEKSRLSFGPMKGEDLQSLVAQVNNLSPELTEKVRSVYEQK